MSTAGYSFSVSTNVAISIFDDFTTQMDWEDTGISGSWAGADADITLVGHSTLTSLAGKLRWFEPTNLGVDDPITVSDPGGATSADVVITPASTGTVKFLQESQIGPYVASSPGTTATILSFDIVWPGGLYVTLDDKLGYRRVDWQFTIEQIDDNGTVIGAPIVKSEALILDTNTPQRRTYSYTVPVGRYRASAERLTGLDDKASTVDKFVWTGLKALLSLTTTPVYGTTTLIAMTIKATNGLASDAQNRIGVRCTRILDYVSPTVNPADAFQDIFTNTVYGGARPLTELDTTKLAALKASWAAHSGFNAVFDAKETVWTALQRSVQVVNSYPVVIDGKVSLVQDGPSTVVSQAFTADNIVKDSLTISYRFDELDGIDGYETEYRDPVSFTPLYSTYPSTAVNP